MAHQVENLLTPQEIGALIEYMTINDDCTDQRPDVRSKHPDWKSGNWPGHIIKKILDSVLDYQYNVEETIFNESLISFRLHVDSGDGNLDKLGHAVLIPLLTEGPSSTVFFNNYWKGASTKFSRVKILPFEYSIPDQIGGVFYTSDLRDLLFNIKNKKIPDQLLHIPDLENTISYLIDARAGNKLSKPDNRTYDYSQIINFNPLETFPEDIRQQYLSHVPAENLHGLQVEKIIEWIPGNAIIFDRTQLHSAGSGHSRKIGITIFTSRVQ
jgi:hypothetical protein